MSKLLVAATLLFATSSFALTCKTAGSEQKITLTIVDMEPNKSHFDDENMIAQVTITELDGKAVNVSFLAHGTQSMMAAGETTELENKEVGFKYEEGFNGSELNGWTIPETVVYQGTQYGECK